MVPIFSRSALAIVVVYDTTNKESFENVMQWIDMSLMHAHPKAVLAVVGNKCDMPTHEVPTDQGREFAKRMGALFFEGLY